MGIKLSFSKGNKVAASSEKEGSTYGETGGEKVGEEGTPVRSRCSPVSSTFFFFSFSLPSSSSLSLCIFLCFFFLPRFEEGFACANSKEIFLNLFKIDRIVNISKINCERYVGFVLIYLEGKLTSNIFVYH